MKAHIKFRKRNLDFSQSLFDEFHHEERPENMKFNFEEGFNPEVSFDSIEISENVIFKALMQDVKGSQFEQEFPGMTVIECLKDKKPVMQVAASTSLVKMIKRNEIKSKDEVRIYVNFEQEVQYIRVDAGLYVTLDELPQISTVN